MKKLFLKQYGIAVMIFLFIGEVVLANFLYPRSEFASDFSQSVFKEYMTEFSGELTAEKTKKILAEQELFLNAKNAESELESRLYKGEFTDRDEFRAKYNELHSVTMRSEALEAVLEKYYYALNDTKNRYILSGSYDGLGRDYPDILMLAAIMIITAAAFLNEESSNVSTFIRTSENGRKGTFKAKIFTLMIFICACQFLCMVCELFVMISYGDIDELSYPIRSIPFFQNCSYSLTISQCFLAMSAMRLLGYFFIASLVMLLAVKIKVPLFTVFIPCSLCLLQQLVFEPAALAYCISTGFLRASGYLGGDLRGSSETDADFVEAPIELLIAVLFFTIIFVVIAVIIAGRYYSCKKFTFKCKTAMFSAGIVIICCTFSGCSHTSDEKVIYNLGDNFFFAQNDEYYFISNQTGITRFGKTDGSEFQILRDPFLSSAGLYGMAVYGNDLYCLDAYGSKRTSVISLEKLSERVLDTDDLIEYSVYSAFANGESLFFSTFDESGIYRSRKNKISKIISEKIYNNQLCFDGRRIFYINSMLELVCYDTHTDERTLISEDFARAVYYDGVRIVYSTDKGIFELNNDFSVEKLSEAAAEKISFAGENIVFFSDGKLFFLGSEIVEIYDKEVLNFVVLPKTNKVLLREYNNSTGEYADVEISIVS